MSSLKRQLILDTETTGLKVEDGHRIIEFAALEMLDRELTGNYLHLYINPERAIDPGATKIHGITDDDVADKPNFSEVADQIIAFIDDSELIIHNAKFDMGFLRYQFNLLLTSGSNSTLLPFEQYKITVVDTLSLARQQFPGSKNNLDALCDRFNISRESRNYHGALIDCHLLSNVYLALTKHEVSMLSFDDHLEHNMSDTGGVELVTGKIIEANDQENALHKDYLEFLDKSSHGNCIWGR